MSHHLHHDDNDDLDSSEGEEGEEEGFGSFSGATVDLFSQKTFPNPKSCLENAKKEHGFDLQLLHRRHQFDCFSYFKLINFIRTEKPTAKVVMEAEDDQKWQKEQYLKPVIEDDPLLMMDPEDFEDDGKVTQDEMPELLEGKPSSAGPKILREDDSSVTLSRAEFLSLQEEISMLRVKLSERDSEMFSCLEDMNRMRLVTQALIGQEDDRSPVAAVGCEQALKSVSQSRTEDEDASYAGSYAHFGIHHEMLSDRVRTEAYRDAIMSVPGLLKDKAVLDLGCGTGILSMFCAQAGARMVVGVDMSDIIHQAMDVVIENGLGAQIELVKGRLEDVKKDLPVREFDVVVSEWMGYFLLFEGMIDSVLDARDKYLKPGGRVLPNRCTMHLQLVSDPQRYEETVGFWKDVYGFRMSCMKKPCLVEASVEVVGKEFVASEPALVHELDLQTCVLEDTEFDSPFAFTATRDCEVTALAGYFDTFFELKQDCPVVSFTTGPSGTPTHWKQTVFYLAEKMQVVGGQRLTGKVEVKRPRRDVRSLEVKIKIDGVMEQTYTVE